MLTPEQVFTMDQGTPEWFAIRRGIPTASMFKKIMTPVKAQLSASADEYIYQLIAERSELGEYAFEPDFQSEDMERGIAMEPEARGWYELEYEVDVEKVGFIKSSCGRFGCSPDGLLHGRTMGLEIKCPKAKTHASWLHEGKLPDKHKVQVHGGMAVTCLNAWTFLSYQPPSCQLKPLVITVERDSFTEKLQSILIEFHERYMEIASRLGVSLWPIDGICRPEPVVVD